MYLMIYLSGKVLVQVVGLGVLGEAFLQHNLHFPVEIVARQGERKIRMLGKMRSAVLEELSRA